MAIGDEIPAGTSTNSTAKTIDHHHPLFLQPSDIPGSSLISIQLTGSEKYAVWSRSMKIGLIGKSKLGFVDGRYTKDKFDQSLHELWKKCNAIVLSWIMNVVSKELLSGIVYKSSAHKVWTDLKDKYDKVDGSLIFFPHKKITTLSQGISTVSAYFSRLTDLWEEYDALMLCLGCDCPESKSYSEHFEYQRLLQFLMGLDETYAQARSQILMMNPIPSVNKAYSMVVSEESHRNMGKSTQTLDMGDSTALFTNKGGRNTGNTYKPRRNNLFCDYCNYKGHTRETCYKLHGYPNNFKARRKANNFPQRPMVNTTNEGQQYMGKATANAKDTGDNSQHFAGTTKVTTLADKSKGENWIVDSGAINHMVHTRELLDKINTNSLKFDSKVHLPDGTSLNIACTGESRIGECGVIRNDLHNGKVKEIGNELEGLYNLQNKQDKAKAATVQSRDHSIVEEDLGVWHGRLGHAHDKVVKQIPNMKFKVNNDRIKDCTIWPLARQGRLPFPKSTSRSNKPFELIHVD
uniref:Retrotransposon Copia-like N-terminal domain-containing protein n=3 Tax=Nicotiana TaxID=4085 RepID=A0A1S3X8U1_TOBAC